MSADRPVYITAEGLATLDPARADAARPGSVGTLVDVEIEGAQVVPVTVKNVYRKGPDGTWKADAPLTPADLAAIESLRTEAERLRAYASTLWSTDGDASRGEADGIDKALDRLDPALRAAWAERDEAIGSRNETEAWALAKVEHYQGLYNARTQGLANAIRDVTTAVRAEDARRLLGKAIDERDEARANVALAAEAFDGMRALAEDYKRERDETRAEVERLRSAPTVVLTNLRRVHTLLAEEGRENFAEVIGAAVAEIESARARCDIARAEIERLRVALGHETEIERAETVRALEAEFRAGRSVEVKPR